MVKTVPEKRSEINFRVIDREVEHIDLILELGLASSTAGAIRFALADTARRHPRFASDIERAIPLAAALEREVFADVAFPADALAEHVR